MIARYYDDNPRVKRRNILKGVLTVLVFTTLLSGAWGQGYTPSRGSDGRILVPDNSSVRLLKQEEIMSGVADLRYRGEEYINPPHSQSRVRFSVQTQGDSIYLLFINELDGSFPTYSSGSYIAKRNIEDGEFLQIKIFYKSEPGSFIRIFPHGDRALMDVFLQGEELYSGINLPLPFNSYLLEPFETIVRVSGNLIDWGLLLPSYDRRFYRDVSHMVDIIRQRLPELPDAEDGALNRDGEWVSIDTELPVEEGGLNCSGFAKWVVDGLYGPMTGGFLSVGELKQRHIGDRGNRWTAQREDERDPFFGLDWTRNLAVTFHQAATGRSYGYKDFDITSDELREYREDIGYEVRDLPMVLYELAIRTPGRFYLGSINGSFGENPTLRQHYHVALFFPVLRPDGSVRITVFERNRETPLDAFIRHYGGEFVHLSAIEASETFEPPPLPQP